MSPFQRRGTYGKWNPDLVHRTKRRRDAGARNPRGGGSAYPGRGLKRLIALYEAWGEPERADVYRGSLTSPAEGI